MKKIITIALLALAMLAAGCENKDKPKILRNGEMLYINVKDNKMRAASAEVEPVEGDTQKRLTPRQLVEKTSVFMFIDPKIGETNISILDEQRDVEHERIKMWGEMVVSPEGLLRDYFIVVRNVTTNTGDGLVCGYIPNAVMEKAEKDIRAAYKAGNIDEVYRLFHEAYTVTPCTQLEYNKLKEKGLN